MAAAPTASATGTGEEQRQPGASPRPRLRARALLVDVLRHLGPEVADAGLLCPVRAAGDLVLRYRCPCRQPIPVLVGAGGAGAGGRAATGLRPLPPPAVLARSEGERAA